MGGYRSTNELILAQVTGKRSIEDPMTFTSKLRHATSGT
jgi:hypothetical protein